MARNQRTTQPRPTVRAGQIVANVGVDPDLLSDDERADRAKAQATLQDNAAKAQAADQKEQAQARNDSLEALAEAQGKYVLSQSEFDEQINKIVEERLAAAQAAASAGPETITMPSPAMVSQMVFEERARMGLAPFDAGVMPASVLPADYTKEVRRSISPAHPVNGTITEIYEGGEHKGFAMPAGPRVVDVDAAPSQSQPE